jgi:hypothetical protein
MSGARIGDNQTSIGLGVLSFIDVAQWLGGFAARAEYFHGMAGGPQGAALALAALGGRRFPFRSVSLDLYGGPGLALQGRNRSVTETPQTRRVEETGSARIPRVLIGGRLNFRAQSVLRTFIGIDGDFGPTDQGDVPLGRGDIHRLPAWSFGVALGATVGTR